MTSCHLARSLVVAAAAAFVLASEPRLISYEPLDESESDAWCDWDSTRGPAQRGPAEAGHYRIGGVASAFRTDVASGFISSLTSVASGFSSVTSVVSGFSRTAAFQARPAAGVNPVCAAEGCASVTARKPLRFVLVAGDVRAQSVAAIRQRALTTINAEPAEDAELTWPRGPCGFRG